MANEEKEEDRQFVLLNHSRRLLGIVITPPEPGILYLLGLKEGWYLLLLNSLLTATAVDDKDFIVIMIQVASSANI